VAPCLRELGCGSGSFPPPCEPGHPSKCSAGEGERLGPATIVRQRDPLELKIVNEPVDDESVRLPGVGPDHDLQIGVAVVCGGECPCSHTVLSAEQAGPLAV